MVHGKRKLSKILIEDTRCRIEEECTAVVDPSQYSHLSLANLLGFVAIPAAKLCRQECHVL